MTTARTPRFTQRAAGETNREENAMNRIHLACWALIASAFALAGLLCIKLDGKVAQPAEAGVVVTRDTFTLLTAKTKDDEEALFVLENTTGRLMVYRLNLANRRLELASSALMGDIFNDAGIGAPVQGGGNTGRGRGAR